LLRSCFAADAEIGFGAPARVGGLEEFLQWAPEFHDRLGPTLHQNTTHRVSFQGPDSAVGSCYLHAVLVDADGTSSLSVFGRYEDAFVRADGRWLIRQRRFHPVWRHRNAQPAAVPQTAVSR
jgi:hypothetical protein